MFYHEDMKDQPIKRRTRCTATTRKGQPCRAWAVPGTDPPRCASHGGVSAKPGAPVGNQNAVIHGFYANGWNRDRAMNFRTQKNQPGENLSPNSWQLTQNPRAESGVASEDTPVSQTGMLTQESLAETISFITQDLLNKHIALSNFIDRHFEELPLPTLSHLLALHAQTATRLGRLLRDQLAIAPEISDGLAQAINAALDKLSADLGVDL